LADECIDERWWPENSPVVGGQVVVVASFLAVADRQVVFHVVVQMGVLMSHERSRERENMCGIGSISIIVVVVVVVVIVVVVVVGMGTALNRDN